jgi:CRP-like cAMP-binding protein
MTISSQEAFLDLCEGAPIKKFQDGDLLMLQGEAGSFSYVILKGAVSVHLRNVHTNTTRQVAHRGEGELIGELSLFQKIRSATVIASGPCECAQIPHAVLLQIITTRHSLALALLAATMDKAREHTA